MLQGSDGILLRLTVSEIVFLDILQMGIWELPNRTTMIYNYIILMPDGTILILADFSGVAQNTSRIGDS